MSGLDNSFTIVGNLAGDPEIRTIASGASVVNFTVIQNPRIFDRQTNEWKDGSPNSFRCSAWRDTAANVAQSLRKGNRVIVVGKLTTTQAEKDGVKTTYTQVEVEEVGPSLAFATVEITRTPSNNGGNNNQGQQNQGQGGFGGNNQGQQNQGGFGGNNQGQQNQGGFGGNNQGQQNQGGFGGNNQGQGNQGGFGGNQGNQGGFGGQGQGNQGGQDQGQGQGGNSGQGNFGNF